MTSNVLPPEAFSFAFILRGHFKPGQRSHEKFPPVWEIFSNIWDDFKPV